MLIQCWPDVYEFGPTINHHPVNVACSLGYPHRREELGSLCRNTDETSMWQWANTTSVGPTSSHRWNRMYADNASRMGLRVYTSRQVFMSKVCSIVGWSLHLGSELYQRRAIDYDEYDVQLCREKPKCINCLLETKQLLPFWFAEQSLWKSIHRTMNRAWITEQGAERIIQWTWKHLFSLTLFLCLIACLLRLPFILRAIKWVS